MRVRRLVLFFLATVVVVYVGVCALLWWLQDRMVFAGAGRGDRGVPPTSPPAVVTWIGEQPVRTRLATIEVAGPRAVVLYFGGNGEDLYAATASLADLVRHGVVGIAAEYPGYGASAGRPSAASLLATARLAADHAKARATALGVPFYVVASSLGSFLGVHVAAAGGVDKLVLRAPPPNLVAVAQRQYWWLPVGLLLAHRFDSLEQAPKVQCPTLVLHGDADTIVPDHFGRELAQALPHATFVSVPGCGHNDLDLSPVGPAGRVLHDFFTNR